MLPLILSLSFGFLTTYLLTAEGIPFSRSSGIVGIDQQKEEKPHLPTSGGIPVLFGFLASITTYLGFETFLSPFDFLDTVLILAALTSSLIIVLIGLLDDIHVKQNMVSDEKSERMRIGLKQWQKPLLLLPAALPLMVVKAGTSQMSIPFLGLVNTGIYYPLLLVPLGLLVVSNATNMLAGMNGLESSLGLIASFSFGTYALINHRLEGAIIAFSLALSLLAFLYYNFYPAKMLPGDSLTYLVGAIFFSAVVISNAERFGVFIFTPWLLEGILKLRSRFQASSLGQLQADGTLKPKQEKIYSLTHIFMRFRLTEKEVVLSAAALEIIICLLGFLIFL